MTLSDLILEQNRPLNDLFRGACIHRITPATAAEVATLLAGAAFRIAQPVWFLAACLCRESRFDPEAYNENLTITRRDPTFAGTDWGIAQRSGRFLPARFPAGTSEAAMKAQAFDPAWAIPLFADDMAGNATWARRMLGPETATPSGLRIAALRYGAPADSDSMALWLATYAYNSGEIGAQVDLLENGGIRSAHPRAVWAMAVEFQGKLVP